MSTSLLDTLACVSLFPDDLASAAVIGGITSQNLRSGTEVRRETSSGAYYPQFQAVYSRKPSADWSTLQIARALDACSLTGLRVSAGTDPGVKFFGQKKAEGGTRASGANHLQFLQRDGIMFPDQITCRHQGDAEIGYKHLVTFDGTNDVWTQSEGVSLPTQTADDQRFTLGPSQIATSSGDILVLDQVKDFTVGFGIAAETEGSDGDVHDTMAYINEIMPMISITMTNSRLLDSSGIPLSGKILDSSHSIFHLRKRSNNGTFVADGTAEHISIIPLSGCAYHDSIFDVRHNANGTVTILIPLLSDATMTAPLSIDTTAAIALPA